MKPTPRPPPARQASSGSADGRVARWYSGFGKVLSGKVPESPGYRIMVATSTNGKVWKKVR